MNVLDWTAYSQVYIFATTIMNSLHELTPFEVERARASDRIMRLTAEHEMALIQRMGQLGFD
jgi:hypothetical protein